MSPHNQEDADNMLWTGLNRANVETVRIALTMGADVNKRHPDGAGAAAQFDQRDTPLHGAFKPTRWKDGAMSRKTSKADVSGVKDIVQLLLEHGADVAAVDSMGNTPLICMAKSDGLKFDAGVETLLVQKSKQAGVLDRGDNIHGYTALHYTASLGNSRLTIKLCKTGANVEVRMKDGTTPLFIAAESLTTTMLSGKTTEIQKHTFTLDGILNYQGNINARDDDGDTIVEKNPRIPLSTLQPRKFDFLSAHPVSGDTFLDLYLQRLSGDTYTSLTAFETLVDVQGLQLRDPQAGLASIDHFIESKTLNEREEGLIGKLRAKIEQQLLLRDTGLARKAASSPRL